MTGRVAVAAACVALALSGCSDDPDADWCAAVSQLADARSDPAAVGAAEAVDALDDMAETAPPEVAEASEALAWALVQVRGDDAEAGDDDREEVRDYIDGTAGSFEADLATIEAYAAEECDVDLGTSSPG